MPKFEYVTHLYASADKQVLQFALRMERQAIARGWARLTTAITVSTASIVGEEGPQKVAKMEAYVVDLQKQVCRGKNQIRPTSPNFKVGMPTCQRAGARQVGMPTCQ